MRDVVEAAAGFRLSELVAALSLATDLGTGQPIEHALRTDDVTRLRRAGVVADLGAVGVPGGVWETLGPLGGAGELPAAPPG